MIRCDALIVGGGPAGSTCARILRQAGWDVVVADRARFPRDKVCAGWLTPEVFPLLDLDPGEYRSAGLALQPITGFRTGVLGGDLVETRYPAVVSYAIRRCEFDDFLLRRAGVRVLERTPVVSLRRTGATWIVNDRIEARAIVGAGGHFCPVARHLRSGAGPARPVVAREIEFRTRGDVPAAAPDTPALFFCRDLQGYGWCVRKGAYLNVGIGRRDGREFNRHVRQFAEFLEETMHVRQPAGACWRGHAYLACGTGGRPLVGDGLLLVGDAAGLAYPESGEGIRPAIDSGRLAAQTLAAAGGRCGPDDLQPYAQAMRRRYPPSSGSTRGPSSASSALGRLLLRSPLFTRHIVLDRWFLRGGSRRASGDRPA